MEPDPDVLDWLGGGFAERDGVLKTKKSGRAESWRSWGFEILGQIGSYT